MESTTERLNKDMKSAVRHGFCDCISLRRKILQWHLRCNNDKSNLSLMSIAESSQHLCIVNAKICIEHHQSPCRSVCGTKVHFNCFQNRRFPCCSQKRANHTNHKCCFELAVRKVSNDEYSWLWLFVRLYHNTSL